MLLRKVVPSFVLVMVLLFMSTLTAFAEDRTITIRLPAGDAAALGAVIQELETGNANQNRLEVELKPDVDSQSNKVISSETDGMTFNVTAFDNGTERSRKMVLKSFVDELQKSEVSTQSQQKIMDDMALADPNVSRMLIPLVIDSTSADIYTAMKWLAPFLPIVRVIFGIGAIVIMIALIGSTIIDLVFIGLPFARESIQARNDEKGGGSVPLVTTDALSVIKETESSLDSSGSYKNAYFIYFKRRVWTYILLSICVLYLVIGELGGLIAWILSLADGIVGGS